MSNTPAAGWFGSVPRNAAGAPVVLVDLQYEDPAARRTSRRWALAAAAGVAIALAAGALWLATSSVPTAPVSRQAGGGARAAAPMTAPVSPEVAPGHPVATGVHPDTLTTPAPARLTRAPVPRPRPPSPPSRPRPSITERRVEPALMSVNAIPWGSVYIDGRLVGNTPLLEERLSPGRHRLRVEHEGYRPYERMIDVASGQRLRITDIALVER